MSGAVPEERVAVPSVTQRWRDVAFLHWSYPATAVQAVIPPVFRPDTFDGRAWVGLTPFAVPGYGPGPLPPLSFLRFNETNLRTYVVGPDGTDGIWFLDIRADSLPVIIGARLGFGAPYHRARLDVTVGGDTVRYSGDGVDRGVRYRVTIRRAPRPPADGDELDHWLTGRWRSWTLVAGHPASIPVQHEPWPLAAAEAVQLEQDITDHVGLPPPEGPPRVHLASGVDARLGFPRPVLRSARSAGRPMPD